MDLRIERSRMPLLRLNAPLWFRDAGFLDWLNKAARGDDPRRTGRLATWYRPSDPRPDEFADFFLTWSDNDGSNSDMPEPFWLDLCDAVRTYDPDLSEVLIWVTNLPHPQASNVASLSR